MRPTDVNGINKAAGEYYHLVYNNVFGVRACSLRLTNVYGPRQLIKHNRQGFIGWFIRLAIENKTIQIYGDGSQLRDFVYVDDAADAFLRAGASDACNGEVFNVGGDRADQPPRPDDAAGRDRRLRPRASTSSGRRRRRRSTSAASTPTRRSSRGRPAGRPRSRSPTGCGGRSRSTASTATTTSTPASGTGARVTPRAHSVPVARARRRRRRRSRRDRSRDRARLVRARARGRGVRSGVRRRDGRAARGRRRHRHRRDRADPARARHRPRRRSDHDAAVGGVHRARDHDGRRAAGVRRHRSGAADDRSRRGSPRAIGPRTRAILPVHLYGQAGRHGRHRTRSPRGTTSRIVEDCCQAHLATAGGRPVGTIGVAGAFSFYPTKNLGALGDGGAVVTNDRGARRPDQAAAQRRPDRPLPPPGAGRQLAARRDCRRRSCARGCRGCAAWTARRRALAATLSRARSRARRSTLPPELRSPATSIICSSCGSRRAARSAGAPRRRAASRR